MEVNEPSAKYLIQQTAGGVPDWRDVKLGAVTSFRTGPFGSALHKSDYVFGGVPVVNPMQIEDGRIKPTERMSVAEEAAERLSEFQLRSGDVVIGRRGEMGRCAFVHHEQDGWLCGTGSMIVRPGVLMDGRFLQRVLSSNQAVRAIESASVGTTMINLNQRTLAELNLHIPISVNEQTSIADALSDADALIDSLEQLLTKKRQIKQGAMQELLTGKRRLPGFDDEWEMKQLGKLADLIKGSGLSKDVTLVSGRRKCILYGELFTTYGQVIHDVVSRTNSSDGVASISGDVLVPGSTTTDGIDLATASALLESGVALGGDINIVRPRSADSFDPCFLANYLTHVKKREIAERAQGSTIVHLYGRDLSDLWLYQPSLAEQGAIAKVLSDMEAEIICLESRLTKARALKQAMAQALLTGRIRIPLDPQEPAAPVPPPKGVGALGSGPARTQEPTP